MGYITIKEFADKHNVSIQAVRYRIGAGKIKNKTNKFNIILVDEFNDYAPVIGRGRKPIKKVVRQKHKNN